MSSTEPTGDPVPGKEPLLRQIRVKDHWLAREARPSTALFKNPVFSSFVESLQSVEDTQAANVTAGGVALYLAKAAIDLKFDPRLEEEDGNVAHVNVYHPPGSGGGSRKTRARDLLEHCRVVVVPTFGS